MLYTSFRPNSELLYVKLFPITETLLKGITKLSHLTSIEILVVFLSDTETGDLQFLEGKT